MDYPRSALLDLPCCTGGSCRRLLRETLPGSLTPHRPPLGGHKPDAKTSRWGRDTDGRRLRASIGSPGSMQVPKLAGCNSQFAHVYQVHDAEQQGGNRGSFPGVSPSHRIAAQRKRRSSHPLRIPIGTWHCAVQIGRSGGGGATESTQSCDSRIWCLRKHPEHAA